MGRSWLRGCFCYMMEVFLGGFVSLFYEVSVGIFYLKLSSKSTYPPDICYLTTL